MAIQNSFSQKSLTDLINYLFTRREAILNSWRLACENDPALAKVSLLSREEFTNLIPVILDIFEQRLLNKPPEADLLMAAQGHGLHRWQKTHGLIDTMQELNHLAQTVYQEIDQFMQLFADADKSLAVFAYKQVVLLMQDTIYGSIQKHDELQRLQASSRIAALQNAIDQMQELSAERSDMLRTSSHDLRGGFGIINSAALLLKMNESTPEEKDQFLDMISRNLSNVHNMLTGLMDLSRLEAGQETLQIESFDAAELLRDITAGSQPMALEKNIILQADGPDTLMVETDRVKLHRIIQNILINALKYTTGTSERPAIVSVSWLAEKDYRWAFSIQDSGPGMPASLAGTFTEQLRPTVEPVAVMGPAEAQPVSVLPDDLPKVPGNEELAHITNHKTKSEGVGLQIVKHLCELLHANLDIESQAGRGTLFRVRLPVHAV